MATLYGRTWTRRELLRHVGDMAQVAAVRPVELVNGNERGIRALQFSTGSGLHFNLLLDRAMDIYEAQFQGQSLAWLSANGPVAPSYHDPHDIGFLYSMPGGLMVTCGLTHAGHAEIDEQVDEELGMHGRIANTPAKNVCFGAEWEEDEYVLWASGDVRETSLFGANLVLRRSVHTRLGQSRIWIKDTVVNQGYSAAPLMLLYHCNLGFPLLGQGSELLAVINNAEPFDKAAQKSIDQFDCFEGPVAGFTEQNYILDHDEDGKNIINVALVNRGLNQDRGLGLYLAYPKKELPYFNLWKMMGEGMFVAGLEPGNCLPEGRSSARKRGRLQMLEPGEERIFHLEIGVLASNEEIQNFESRLRGADAEA